ncbi:MAG: HPr(Ser) kinase/phosphatase [Vicinamibacterales bacterium]
MSEQQVVTVEHLLRSRLDAVGLPLQVMAGASSTWRVIASPHVQKTGLALAGFHEYLQPGRILVLGESEVRFVESLAPDVRTGTLQTALAHDLPCVMVTGGWGAPTELISVCERAGVPLLSTSVATPLAIAKVTGLLDDMLATREHVHGVLLDVIGLGVLLIGESGIGKSECALDLIVRGHRLVADDTVEIRLRGETVLIGTCPELTRHHMEVRGLGIINILELFGVASIRASKRVELVVRLERWDPEREYDRIGLDRETYDIGGLRVPLISLPVRPGRNLAILVEVAARNELLRSRGHDPARELVARLDRLLAERREGDGMSVEEDA